MRKRNQIAIGIFITFYIGLGFLLTWQQERLIYYPFPQDFTDCPAFAEAEKVVAASTRIYAHNTDKPVVVLYHGNAGSACDRDFYADLFTQSGYGYLIVEYAGYSNDSVPPTHERIKQDVRNVIAYTEAENINISVIVGESLGTGFASYHTSRAAPEKLLLISPFTDLKDVAAERFWFYPTTLLVDNALDNDRFLENYLGTVKIIHGKNDRIVPYSLGKVLYDSIAAEKSMAAIDGAGHNNLFTYAATYSAINTFLLQE